MRTAHARSLSTTQGVALARDVQYVYEDGSFVPLAQYINSSTGEADHISPMRLTSECEPREALTTTPPKLYHYVCDQIGTPQLLLNQSQEVVWEAESRAWGETYVEPREVKEGVVNNHRFQGQYYDEESELHYNTFSLKDTQDQECRELRFKLQEVQNKLQFNPGNEKFLRELEEVYQQINQQGC